MKKPKRPASISSGPLKAFARKPPTKSDNRWYWQVWYNDGRKQKTAQYQGKSANRRATPTEMRAHLLDVLEGDWRQSPEPESIPPDLNVNYVYACWLLHNKARLERGRIKPATMGLAERTFRLYVKSHYLGEVKASQLSTRHLQGWVNDLQDRGLSARSVSVYWHQLRNALNFGRDRGLMPDQSIKGPDLPKVEGYTNNHTTPSRAEVEAAIEQSTGWKRVALILLLGTGARCAEVTDMTWQQWDRAGRLLELDGKTGKRTLPCNNTVQAALVEWWMAQGQPKKGRVFQSKSSSNMLYCHVRLFGFTPHGVRRCVSTILIDAGTTPKNYEAIMGHSYQMGLKTYATARPSKVLAAVHLLGK